MQHHPSNERSRVHVPQRPLPSNAPAMAWGRVVRAACAAAVGAIALMTLPVAALAQVVSIPASQQPLAGNGVSLFSDRDDHTAWSRPATALSTSGAGWRYILMADMNGDGLDDLCGLYGPLNSGQFVYGCVLNSGASGAHRFAGNLIQAHAFHGSPAPSIHSTIAAVDYNRDGKLDLCGRTVAGITCQRGTGSGFQAPALLSAAFSDQYGWTLEPYFSTIQFPTSGLFLVCARGDQGAFCIRRPGTAGGGTAVYETSYGFADWWGWNRPEHFRTFRFVDVNGDGALDICGRGDAGIWCSAWLSSPQSAGAPMWEAPVLWTGQYANGYGWADKRYFNSVIYGDLNGDGRTDVCGRGSAGLYCGISQMAPANNRAAQRFDGAFTLAQAQFPDATGWGANWQELRSLQVVDFDNDGKGDVCGLLSTDFYCARSLSTAGGAAFEPLVRRIKSPGMYAGSNNATSPAFERGRIVAARLYPGTVGGTSVKATGFCWVDIQGAVSCSNPWR